MSIESPEKTSKTKVTQRKLPIILIAFVIVYALAAFQMQRLIINYTDLFTFFEDGNIFFKAGAKGLLNGNPYQPFGIGTSFFYPPVALLIFAPLSQLPTDFATVLWLGLDLLAYLLSLYILNLTLKPVLSRAVRICGFIIALLYLPLFESLYAGQVNTWILLGLALFTLGYYNEKYRWLGDAGLAVAILIKVTPIMLVVLPLFQRDWRRCWRIAASCVMLVVLSIVFFGFGPWLDFIAVSPQVFAGVSFGWNESISALFEFTHLAILGKAFVVLLILTWLYICLRYKTNQNPKETGLIISFGIVTLTISSTLLWYHHLTFLVVPFGYLLYFCWTDKRLTSLRLPSVLALFFIEIGRAVEFTFLITSILTLMGYLLLYVCLLTAIRRKKLLVRPKKP